MQAQTFPPCRIYNMNVRIHQKKIISPTKKQTTAKKKIEMLKANTTFLNTEAQKP